MKERITILNDYTKHTCTEREVWLWNTITWGESKDKINLRLHSSLFYLFVSFFKPCAVLFTELQLQSNITYIIIAKKLSK